MLFAAVCLIGLVALFALWDWNWFRGPVERLASARMHRQVTLAGDLQVKPWSWRPVAVLNDVRIANPAWAGKGDMARLERIVVSIRLAPLLWGRLDLETLQFDRPRLALYADARGRKTWDFSDGQDRKPLNLPPIRRFSVNSGQLTFRDDARGLRFRGAIEASEQPGAQQGFHLNGDGRMRGEPFRLALRGGPLVNISRDRPYPFEADVRAGDTRLTARGTITKPFDFGAFQAAGAVRGPDMAALFPLTGVPMPNTPPYNLRARLSRSGTIWRIIGLGGRVGDSDLEGELSINAGQRRSFLSGRLTSRSLDFDDLGAVFGGAPAVGPGETASPGQVAVHRVMAAQQRIFPDSRLDLSRLRAMDADVTFRALSIRDTPVKLSSASARLRLNAGLLRIEPLRLDLPRGRVEGSVSLDGRKSTPLTSLDLRLIDARIEQFVPVRGGTAPLTGSIVGRARLSGQGDSLHKAFAAANGEVMVITPGGEIRKAFAELLGVNIVKGLGLLLTDDRSTTPIRCGVAHFVTRAGVMRADRVVFDTGPVLVTGSGTVNLATERLDLRLHGRPKKFRLVRVSLPIKVSGPITAPKFGVSAGKAIAQGGAAIGLAALLTPLAALLPFVDSGLAKDANCAALIGEARQDGVPIRKPR